MADEKIPRRDFLKGAGAGTAAAAALATGFVPAPAEAAPAPAGAPQQPEPDVWLTLTPSEAAFITASVDTLIPADELTPSGTDCGVASFIDRQLAGAYGNGARLYRQGPFVPANADPGYHCAVTRRH